MQKFSKLGEEGPDLIPDVVPGDFSEQEARRFRERLGLCECGDPATLRERSWRL